MYYTVNQEVTNQVCPDMSLWQERPLPMTPTTPQNHTSTHPLAPCFNNPATTRTAAAMSTTNIPPSQQEQQQGALSPAQASLLTSYVNVPRSQDAWFNYVSQEPVTFDDTLRDCINMLSGRKPHLNVKTPATNSCNNVLVVSSQSAPILPTTTPTSSAPYQSATATIPSLPNHQHHPHNHQHHHHQLPHQEIYPPSFPHQHQQRKRVKSMTWVQLQGPAEDTDAIPRRQKPRYKDDEYSPKWVRYSGHLKEGYCDTCTEGRWLQLKNSAYWYHKQFYHGISSVSGKRFAEPLEQRLSPEGVIEGLCHQCGYYVPICNGKRKRNNILWYKHAHKCHIYNKPEKFSQSYRML